MTTIEENPRIYYRTNATRQAVIADPAVNFTDFITNMPASQILEFEDTAFIIEEVKRVRQLNITYDPKSNPDGNFEISSQFNGLLGKDLRCVLTCDSDQTAKLNKIEAFMFRLQKEQAFHKNGSIGFWFPPASNFSLDPTDERGYYMDNDESIWVSRSKDIESLVLMLKFGGKKIPRT